MYFYIMACISYMNLYFLFFCISSRVVHVIIAESSLGLEVVCVTNCNPAYIGFNFVLKVTCMGHPCPRSRMVQWSLYPRPLNLDWDKEVTFSNNKDTIIVNANVDTFKENDTVRFKALIDGESAEKLLVFKIIPLSFDLDCELNCEGDADPTMDYVLKAKCIKGCAWVTPTTYRNWLIGPEPADKSLIIMSKDKLTIKRNAYKGETMVYIIFEVGKIKFTHKIQYNHKRPLLIVKCTENCEEFTITKPSIFKVNCEAACVSGDFIWTISPTSKNIQVTGPKKEVLTLLKKAHKGGVNVSLAVTQGGLGLGKFSFITKGIMSIEPTSGVTGTTKFYVRHDYPPKLTMSVYQKIPGEAEALGVLLYEGPNLAETSLFLSVGNPACITIIVQDFHHKFFVTATVEATPPLQPGETISKIIPRKVLEKTGDTLPSLINKKDWIGVVQMAALLFNILSQSNSSFSDHYRNHILNEISKVAGEMDPQQIITLLMRSANKIDLSSKPPTCHLVADSLRLASERIENNCCRYHKEDLQRITEDIMFLAGTLSKRSETVNDAIEDLFFKGMESYYSYYEDAIYSHIKELRHLQASTYSLIKTIEAVGHFLDNNQEPVVLTYNRDMASSTQYLIQKPEIVRVYKVSSYLNISGKLAQELSKNEKPLGQIASITPNPFWWHPIGRSFGTEVIMVNVFYDNSKIAKMDHFLDIYLKIDKSSSISNPVGGYFHENGPISYTYRFTPNIGSKVEIYCRFVNEDYFVFLSSSNPTILEIREKGQRITKGREFSHVFTAKKDFFFLGIATWAGNKPRYEVSITAIRCLSYIENTWTTEHCKTGGHSVPGYVHCQCNHLSLFAATILVPPNKIIDLKDFTFREVLFRSSIIIIFLTVVVGVWGVLMAFANYRDRQLEENIGAVMTPTDTIPGDKHLYLTCIETGAWIGAGTSSHVAIQLIGRKARSRIHLIHGPKMLSSGGEDWWALFCPVDLGVIMFVRLFHDSYGKTPDWFCQRVTVQHPSSRQKFIFIVDKWFSLIKGDGQVERIIPLTRKRKQPRGKVLFPMIARDSLQDEHLWFSVFGRPPGSSFTSKERITVAFTILLLAMLTNAMFFGLTDNESIDPKPKYVVSLYEMIILIEELMITFPIALILISIFRKSLPFRLSRKKKQSSGP